MFVWNISVGGKRR